MSVAEDSTTERWRAVPGFEGWYEVSDHGRVRSLPRVVERSDGVLRRFPGKIRKIHSDKRGYQWLSLSRGAGCRWASKRIHVLVLEAFVGPRPAGHEGCHSDGVKSNNHLSNLRWGTPEENSADRIKHGRLRRAQREKSTLTPEEVVAIRALRERLTQPEIAEIFGLTQQTIHDIQAHRSWKGVHVVCS